MRRASALVLLSLAVAASAHAVTFTQITACCSPQEFGATHPAWSSDAGKIAVTYANDYAGYEISVGIGVISPTGVPVPGYSANLNFAAQAAWAPDATRYVCQLGDDFWLPPFGLLIVDASGTHTELTFGFRHAQPAWSPDGATIAFADLTDGNIWSLPAAGGVAVPVTTQGGAQPAWSADGAHIVYTHAGDLWTIPAGGGVAVQLTSGPANDTQPAGAPNGRWIAFTSDRSGNEDLFVMPIAGGAPIQLTTDAAADRNPSWAPDSERIAFESTRSGNPNIWIASDLPDFTVAVEPSTWTALKQLYR